MVGSITAAIVFSVPQQIIVKVTHSSFSDLVVIRSCFLVCGSIVLKVGFWETLLLFVRSGPAALGGLFLDGRLHFGTLEFVVLFADAAKFVMVINCGRVLLILYYLF